MEEVFDTDAVSGVLHRPEQGGSDGIVLTHGAGSNASAPLLVRLARAFAEAGYLTLRFDLPFRRQRLKGAPSPATAARDREGIALAVQAMKQMAPGRVFAGGHSYGGRQTAMTAAEQPGLAEALLLLSYPLHPPAKPEQKRTGFFPELRVPALFVHGARDPFGSVEDLRAAMPLIPARTSLLVVASAGHDLKPAAALAPEILAQLVGLGAPE